MGWRSMLSLEVCVVAVRRIDRARHPVLPLRRGIGRRGSALSVALLLATMGIGYVTGFGAYGLVAGAGEYLAGEPERAACDTPGSRFGWRYEAINYDIRDDALLLSYTPDPSNCGSQGKQAGLAVRSADGTRIAGWYIPAGVAARPIGPTVVLVHGGKSNKSGMLDYAPAFHARYNLVLLDLRNSGRSTGRESTGGVLEQDDLRAMLDWLDAEKGPGWIGVMGNSNGAATALAEAVGDSRVRALILDSMHATVERQLSAVITTERGLPAWPAAPAIVTGVSLRLGQPLESADPLRTIAQLHERPVLLTHGSADHVDRPVDSLELNVAAARAAGVDVRVEVCPGADHGEVVRVCGEAWAEWVLDFLATARGVAGH